MNAQSKLTTSATVEAELNLLPRSDVLTHIIENNGGKLGRACWQSRCSKHVAPVTWRD